MTSDDARCLCRLLGERGFEGALREWSITLTPEKVRGGIDPDDATRLQVAQENVSLAGGGGTHEGWVRAEVGGHHCARRRLEPRQQRGVAGADIGRNRGGLAMDKDGCVRNDVADLWHGTPNPLERHFRCTDEVFISDRQGIPIERRRCLPLKHVRGHPRGCEIPITPVVAPPRHGTKVGAAIVRCLSIRLTDEDDEARTLAKVREDLGRPVDRQRVLEEEDGARRAMEEVLD